MPDNPDAVTEFDSLLVDHQQKTYSSCTECSLHTNKIDPDTGQDEPRFQAYLGVGKQFKQNEGILFVVETPDAEFFYRSPLECSSILPIKFLAESCSIPLDQCAITTTVLCPKVVPSGFRNKHFADTGMCKGPTEAEVGSCRPRLVEEISFLRPKLVVAMGSSAYRAVAYNKHSYQVQGVQAMKHRWAMGQILCIEVPSSTLGLTSGDNRYPTKFMQPFVTTYGLWELNRREDFDNPTGLWKQAFEHVLAAMSVQDVLAGIRKGEIVCLEDVNEWAATNL